MANLWLTGEGEPTLGTGTMGDYYRDTVTNMVYFRENPTTWVVVPAFTPNPDGVGTTWIHGTGAPLNTLGSDTNYYYDDADKIVYYKDAGTWVAKGSLDFIGVYGVQWGNGSGAPANTPQLNNLPASSFYLDVLTSDIYFKNLSLQWELKGQLGGGGGSSVTVINSLTSTSTTNALSAAQGKVLKDTIDALPAPVTVENVLNSTSTTNALSAAQGKALMDSKLDSSAYNDYYKGTYTTLGNLQSAHATSTGGSYALVDGGNGQSAVIYVWDAQDGWVQGGASGSLANTDALAEGSTNLYFTNSRAISAVTATISTAVAASLDVTINTQPDTSYTLLTVDNDGKTYLRMTNAGANTVTIPSTQTKPISIRQAGAGPTTLQEGSGVTLKGTRVFTAQHQTKTIIPLGSGIYDVVG